MSKKRSTPVWLSGYCVERSEATLARVAAAIEFLRASGATVSLRSICETVKAQCGVGMSQSTVLRNEAAYALYADCVGRHIACRQTASRDAVKKADPGQQPKLKRRAEYLSRLRKDELVAKVLELEEKLSKEEKANIMLRDEVLKQRISPK